MADVDLQTHQFKYNIAEAYRLVHCLGTGRSSQRSDLDPVSNAESFTICHRDQHGATNWRYEANDDIAICVVESINICRSMLGNQTVRNAFTELAKDYSLTYPTAWFLQKGSPKYEGDMSRVADGFLRNILDHFPIVFVDDTWKNRRSTGGSVRALLDGEFKSCNMILILNGASLNHMVKAAKKAKQATHDTEREHHEAFLLKHTKTLLHELGHIFTTYLSRGRQGYGTPPTVNAPKYLEPLSERGEAGRKLEALVFGGTLAFWPYPIGETSEDACGAPYLYAEEGHWLIKPETIKRFVNRDFKFPFDHGVYTELRNWTPLDPNMPKPNYTNPMAHPMWAQHRKHLETESTPHRSPSDEPLAQRKAAGDWES